MLKLRVITAIVLILFSLLVIILCPSPVFAGVSGLFFLVALWEWTRLAGFVSRGNRILGFIWVMVAAFVTILMLALSQALDPNLLKTGMPKLIFAFWVVASIIVIRYPKDVVWLKSKIAGVLMGTMVLLPAWAMMVALQRLDVYLLLYVIALVAVSDTAAYFVGKRFGKHKLASQISPGKTWEGVAGAFSGVLLLALGSYSLLEPLLKSFVSLPYWIFLSLAASIFSIVGDLFESIFKRMRNLKDSGHLLPGHGGILDRIDGLVAAVPVFTVGLM